MSETQSRTKLSVWIEASVTPNDAGGGSGQHRASETTSPVPSESSDDASSEDGNESDEVESSITFPSDSPFRAVGWAASICPTIDGPPSGIEAFKAALPLFACP